MAIEQKRLCGYRKAGAMYLVGGMQFGDCHRLPVKIPEIKFFRGYKEINPYELIGVCNRVQQEPYQIIGEHSESCPKIDADCITCNICNPPDEDLVHGMMFVGEQYYSPGTFAREALKLGVSKRISNIPNDLVLGKTIVYLAFKKMPFKTKPYGTEYIPSIFMAFKPERVEMLIKKSDATEDKLKELKTHNITPIIVPDNDGDHK